MLVTTAQSAWPTGLRARLICLELRALEWNGFTFRLCGLVLRFCPESSVLCMFAGLTWVLPVVVNYMLVLLLLLRDSTRLYTHLLIRE